ncbi:tRNA pseudouridine(38-40) synthase TruA [Candidatus Methylacidiphilum infernorum]|uniref:tRNA pseudouridine synthase A n=1 Tax=Methylacidiphilum infernorum (isolate V4) TaxID=481448 RepID=TRUA_METI4|nr:tRNA pseudouridine(38-40) synthase TruA [Candidatus Methylacidiphilum infernorum]B3E0A0.1 RecName: Full=tRNA pseudouridine synthase A; AltName: Full=tRNA pseudouridine(38-40) synthase; AltName: Full=tRNA pseudouridylate synthase I; AltName: Full=tRNA-uridine isomerase I [Methylacidiphilum infernorum V4]ACD84329.1 Pseudouridylate synthase [Methylacidiphilum infernorum V4]
MNLAVVGYKLTLSYCGSGFHGWQRQGELPTVQRALEEAVAKIWEEPIPVEGAGRTDAGVHAKGQVASFAAPRKLEPEVLKRALNYHLPDTVRVWDARIVPREFSARFDAVSKTYQYLLWNDPVMDPFYLGRAWHIPRAMDVEMMNEAARLFLGKHNFAAFVSNPGMPVKNPVRTVLDCFFLEQGSLVFFNVKADGFLYRMVRNMVGALVKVGLGRLSRQELKKIFENQKRIEAFAAAPPWGLYLLAVDYPPDQES